MERRTGKTTRLINKLVETLKEDKVINISTKDGIGFTYGVSPTWNTFIDSHSKSFIRRLKEEFKSQGLSCKEIHGMLILIEPETQDKVIRNKKLNTFSAIEYIQTLEFIFDYIKEIPKPKSIPRYYVEEGIEIKAKYTEYIRTV